GVLYIADEGSNRILRVAPDGIISTVQAKPRPMRGKQSDGEGGADAAGDADIDAQVDGDLSLDAPLDVAIARDGSIYIADSGNALILHVGSAYLGFSTEDYAIPSEDGGELYVFRNDGLHLQTLDAFTGEVIYKFKYDEAGLLAAIENYDGLVTRIERRAGEVDTKITAPYGQRTTLTAGPQGYLASISNPAGETIHCEYERDGLLVAFKDAAGNSSIFTYDESGRLTKDQDAAGGFLAFKGVRQADGATVVMATALGQESIYSWQRLPTGEDTRETACCGGRKIVSKKNKAGTTTTTYPDGMTTTWEQQPDPRFGVQSPILSKAIWQLTNDLKATITFKRKVEHTGTDSPLDFDTLTDKLTLNGRTYSTVFDRKKRQITYSTPMKRKHTISYDEGWRLVTIRSGKLEPATLTYDEEGRVARVERGAGVEARVYLLGYDEQSRLAKVTDPEGVAVEIKYDESGRAVRRVLSDGRHLEHRYDANGNARGLTLPGGSEHTFQFGPTGLMSEYEAPRVGDEPPVIRYGYNADDQLTRVNLPDGTRIELEYAGPNLIAIKSPQGSTEYKYNAETGQLTELIAPGGSTLQYKYTGPLLAATTWSGSVSGTVLRTYDENLRITRLDVNGNEVVALAYDKDGLLEGAGSLRLRRDPENGYVIGVELGELDEIYTYNSFGEV
ncbi:MAG: hypothetical protein M3328_17675, partial [Chloroflexota bacterium]|nr:hypothetical protein [Chloroflexota bacterium]